MRFRPHGQVFILSFWFQKLLAAVNNKLPAAIALQKVNNLRAETSIFVFGLSANEKAVISIVTFHGLLPAVRRLFESVGCPRWHTSNNGRGK